MPDNERVIRVLRAQAWERAKAALQEGLVTFCRDTARPGQFDELNAKVKAFVQDVENNGLAE